MNANDERQHSVRPPMLTELVLASSNQGKRREFERLLLPLGVTVIDQASLGVEPAPEPHATYLEKCLSQSPPRQRADGQARLG